MIQRDYLMRQVQTLIQALQEVLDLHRQGETAAALHTVHRALGTLDEDADGTLRGRPLGTVLAFCRRGEAFQPELATAVADLLKVEGDLLAGKNRAAEARKSYARALLLRRRAAAEGAPLSLDAASEAATLKEKLGSETLAEIERVARGGT
ncbi:MAG: hypothetical protein BRD47_00725 [Bacteroidetes bacterium QS_8_68_28]|nr:MAG: hypothetical protein BRD47_00725 [Bacteroidetes bacterium QS_8_68_28]